MRIARYTTYKRNLTGFEADPNVLTGVSVGGTHLLASAASSRAWLRVYSEVRAEFFASYEVFLWFRRKGLRKLVGSGSRV